MELCVVCEDPGDERWSFYTDPKKYLDKDMPYITTEKGFYICILCHHCRETLCFAHGIKSPKELKNRYIWQRIIARGL